MLISVCTEASSNRQSHLCIPSSSLHAFLTELLFCVGNTIDVVEIHTQAFRRKRDGFYAALGHNSVMNSSATARASGIQASINDRIDPASEWMMSADGTVREKKRTEQDDNDAFKSTL